MDQDNNLGIKYFSSSTDKKFILDQKNNSNNFKYKIVRLFSNRKDAIFFEAKIHEKFKVDSG